MIFAGIEIIGGVALTIFFAGTGTVLIAEAVRHFGATYAEYTKTDDWDATLNNAGISFGVSVTTDFGYNNDYVNVTKWITNQRV